MVASFLLGMQGGLVCQGGCRAGTKGGRAPHGGRPGTLRALTQPQQKEQEGGQHYPAVLLDQRVLSPAGWQESRTGMRGDASPTPPVTLPPPRGPKGKALAACSGDTKHRELEQGRASPAAGVVGALGSVADGAEGPLGAADGHSAGIPAGHLGPVRGRGSKEGVVMAWWGMVQGLRLGFLRDGGTERGQGDEELKVWGLCRTQGGERLGSQARDSYRTGDLWEGRGQTRLGGFFRIHWGRVTLQDRGTREGSGDQARNPCERAGDLGGRLARDLGDKSPKRR